MRHMVSSDLATTNPNKTNVLSMQKAHLLQAPCWEDLKTFKTMERWELHKNPKDQQQYLDKNNESDIIVSDSWRVLYAKESNIFW